MTEQILLPAVALRGLVVFPSSSVSFDIIRKESHLAVEEAMKSSKEIFLVTQRDIMCEKPTGLDLYKIGCIATVRQFIKLGKDLSRVMVDVKKRAYINEFRASSPYFEVSVTEIASDRFISEQTVINEAYMRSLSENFERYLTAVKKINPNKVAHIFHTAHLPSFADAIAANIDCSYEKKQEILETYDVYERAEKLLFLLSSETDIAYEKQKIDAEVKKQIDKNQREYYLREEMRVIEKELGDSDGFSEEVSAYRKKIKELDLNEENRNKLLKETERLAKMQSAASDSAVIRNYLDTVLELPWGKLSNDSTDISKASKILDSDHFGLEKIKQRILEYLAVHALTGGTDGVVLCLAGPPGTGKTSIARSLATAMGREYVRISLGGVHDEAEIRGHRKTYIGSMPGRIIEAVKRAGTQNPLIVLDEIDKLGSDYKGDPSSALLEVLDFEQNHSFRDNYIELPFDLSKIIFIATANNISNIPAPLYDRIETVEVSGYTDFEKFEIAKRHLIPKQAYKNGLKGKRISITDDAIYAIIHCYTKESGVRELERKISELMRKIAKIILSGEKKSAKVTAKNISDYLGRKKYLQNKQNDKNEIGTVTGLAWTSVGGTTLSVEVNVMKGTGQVQFTGNLGDVMKESALTAVSYVRSQSEALNIADDFYKTKDIHIHVPEGAVPKDGPSAGITIATAVASALTDTPVKSDIAMTGEITLRGKVLPIGGLKEKSLAAHRAGIKTIIIPDENYADLQEIPESIRHKINFITAKKMDTVFKNAFVKQ